MNFSNKTVIVTGGARGIGKSIAQAFGKAGAHVMISDINAEELERTKNEFTAAGIDAACFAANVTSADEMKELVNTTVEKFGSVDVMINNAGITKDTLAMRMKETDWDLVLDINLKGVFLGSQAVLKPMMKQRSGTIINISSVVGIMGNAGQLNYSASKAGIIGLSKSLAKEVAKRGIRVNAIAPGFIRSDMTDALKQDVVDQMLDRIPMNTFGEVEDIAGAALFLASDYAKYITGQVIVVDGGMIM